MAKQSDNTLDIVLFNTQGNEPDNAKAKETRLEAMKDVLQRIQERSPNPIILCQDNIDEEKRFLLWSSLDSFQQCPGISVASNGKTMKPLVGIFQRRNPERTYDMRYIPYRRLGDMADTCGIMNFMCCVLSPRCTQMNKTNKRILVAVFKEVNRIDPNNLRDVVMRIQKEEQCDVLISLMFHANVCFEWKSGSSDCDKLKTYDFEETGHGLKLQPQFYKEESIEFTLAALSPINNKAGDNRKYPFTKCISSFFDQSIPDADANFLVLIDNLNDQLLDGSLDEIHQIITKKLGASSCKTTVTENEEAAIYFRPDLPYLTRFVAPHTSPTPGQTPPPQQQPPPTPQKKPQEPVDFAERMKACVFTSHAIETKRILVISYHGPYTQMDIIKKRCFINLVKWAERMRCEQNCDAVLVGGDWNVPSATVREWKRDVEGEAQHGTVAENYQRDSGRPLIDFVYYWPSDQLEVVSTTVIRQDREHFGEGEPFGHPVLLYRIKFAATAAAEDKAIARRMMMIKVEPSTPKEIQVPSAKWKADSALLDTKLTTKPSCQGLLSAAREPYEGDTPNGKTHALPTSARQQKQEIQVPSAKGKADSALLDTRLTTKPSRQGLLSAAREPQEGDTPYGKAHALPTSARQQEYPSALPTSARQQEYPPQVNPKDKKKSTSSVKAQCDWSSEFVCDICGQDCHASIGLWSHQHHKHGVTSSGSRKISTSRSRTTCDWSSEFVCYICGKDCHARIGLWSHQHHKHGI